MVNPAIQDKRLYVEVRPKGSGPWVVFESKEHALDFCDNAADEYEFREAWFTPKEFANLKEFNGW